MRFQKNKIWVAILVLTLFFPPGSGFSKKADNNEGVIPNKLPPGFAFAHPPEFYGTYEKPGKNGTIYDYINGGGEIYIKHGFQAVSHMILADGKQNSITLDIYNMGTPENAAATLADETICPEGFSKMNIGTGSKSYHYEPDYLIYFVKGKYFIYLALNNDALAEILRQFAAEIYRDIK